MREERSETQKHSPTVAAAGVHHQGGGASGVGGNLSSVWGSSAAQKLNWTQPTQMSAIEQSAMSSSSAKGGVAWGGAGLRSDHAPTGRSAILNPMWDGPSLESANKTSPAINKKSSSSSKSTTSVGASGGNKGAGRQQAGNNNANDEHE
ncbi:unnamed protein product, partial [Anisakis simplex]|uniref:Trinucleotide repeat-containing gene 6C protein n=1 Tax=Anisakis simplex TaxID=6269 RepID=A0A0M3JEG8_ANISI